MKQYVKCYDKYNQELFAGDYVDVQRDGVHLIYKKEDGQLYFKPYGEEDRVSSYFSNDIVKCDVEGNWLNNDRYEDIKEKKVEKMTPKEYRTKLINTYPRLLKICLFLGISDLEIIDNDVWKNNSDYNYRIREVNPYNPLSWILLLFFLPVGLLINGFNRESFDDIKKLFKYR
jgi:hypothetical protein